MTNSINQNELVAWVLLGTMLLYLFVVPLVSKALPNPGIIGALVTGVISLLVANKTQGGNNNGR